MRYEALLDQVGEALESGSISRRDLERLLERGRERPSTGRPGISGVLAAIGVLVVFIGLALLYTLQWHNLHGTMRTLSPFLFPALALAAAILLDRAGRPVWESELAGLVGFVALGLAFLAAAGAFHPGDDGRFGLVAGATGTAVVIAMHLALRNVRLTGWGLSVALVTLTPSSAAVAGADRDAAGWVLAGQAAVAFAAGGLLLPRLREAAAAAFRAALLLCYMAALAGQPEYGFRHLSVWHMILSLAVVAAFVLAVSLDLDGLVWIGVIGSLVWLAMAAAVIGTSSGWALAMVLVGLGLVGLSLLVAGLRRRRIAIR
jgi:hypothetical protein